jgi:hypothetical protein
MEEGSDISGKAFNEEMREEREVEKRLEKEREFLEIAEIAISIRQKTRELEWFEMESKVRSLVYELLQPTAQRVDTNRVECSEVHKDVVTQESRIENLEYILKITDKHSKGTIFDDINQKASSEYLTY